MSREDNGGFPVVKITGGAVGKNLKLEVDGEEVDRVTRVELIMDVHDAVRLVTYRFVEVDVELRAVPEDGGYKVLVRQQGVQEVPVEGKKPMYIPVYQELAEATGKTVRQALQAAIDALPPDPA